MTMRKQCAGVAKQTCSVLGETVIPCYIKQAQRQVQLFTQRYFIQYLSVFLRLKQVKTMLATMAILLCEILLSEH